MFEVTLGCLFVTAAAWAAWHRTNWSPAMKLSAVGLSAGIAGTLGMLGALACAATSLDQVPGSPGYCPDSTINARGAFGLGAWAVSAALLLSGATVARNDRRQRQKRWLLRQPPDSGDCQPPPISTV